MSVQNIPERRNWRGERHVGVISDLETRLKSALQSDADRGALLRELSMLAQDDGFRNLVYVWAPALIDRDPQFFQSFLLRHLDPLRHRKDITDLLPTVEQTGADDLFRGMYRMVAEQGRWDKEIMALAQSGDTDEKVAEALGRRDCSPLWYSLSEKTALALYRRAPELFESFLRDHLRGGWGRGGQYKTLLKEARPAGGDLYWHIFRQFVTGKEWQAELSQLLKQDIPADQIAAELTKRHPDALWDTDPSILVDFVDKYGETAMPYIEQYVQWISGKAGNRLLRSLEKLDDENLYWRLFFRAGNRDQWHKSLKELAARGLPEAEFLFELQRRTPQGGGWWRIPADLALDLYRQYGAAAVSFIDRFLQEPGLELYEEARRRGDEDMLDCVTFYYIGRLGGLHYRAFPPPEATWMKPDPESRAEYERVVAMLTERLDGLYASSPGEYVIHAARILGRYKAFSIWMGFGSGNRNAVFDYLAEQHVEAWLDSPHGVRDLLESPNIHIQKIGLKMLGKGGPQAAERVSGNLPLIRALLIGRAMRGTKKQALRCLEQAAREDARYAEAILPILEDAAYYRGKTAVDERIIASLVRTKREIRLAAQASAG